MEAAKPDESGYHYWLPVFLPSQGPHGTRHAFKGGRKWDGRSAGTTACGIGDVPMAEPSEIDWIMAPTCLACTSALVEEQQR
ncbi:hypothetical protein [Actinopolyspora saharensis]|uniref:hypothetical protein n=1 Tax=Actinopolyspora saharensis TaxID=995062 RepID=UPI003F672AE5